MKGPVLILSFAAVLRVGLLPAGAGEPLLLAGREEILSELKAAPRSNPEREARLRDLFLQAGAPEEEVRLEPVPGAGHNVMVTKEGETAETIVIGAHLDKVAAGDGVIDDWSGAAMVTNLYQAFRKVKTRHTLVFIGFCGEEQGLLGSKRQVEAMGEEGVRRCRVMLNLEVLGVGGPFIWTNGSSDGLEGILHQVAREEGLELLDHEVRGVGADSMPFGRAGIANITIDGLPVERLGLIHSEDDTFDKIDPDVYWATYRLAAAFLRRLDQKPVQRI